VNKVIKFLWKGLNHPVTYLNLTFVGMLFVIQFVHTKAHLTLEADVHGHVHRTLKKNPDLARSSCYELGF
jgi:hypothetical protein